MPAPVRNSGPPTERKGNAAKTRELDEMVLAILVEAERALYPLEIGLALRRRWEAAHGPLYMEAKAIALRSLKRLERAGKVENLGRPVGWRTKERR